MVAHFAHTKAKLFSLIGGLRGSQKLSFVWGGLLILGLGVGLWHMAHFVFAPPTRTPLPVIYPPAGPMRIPPQEPSQTPSYRVYDNVAPTKKKAPDTLNAGEERPPVIPRKPEVKQKSKKRVSKRVSTSSFQSANRVTPYRRKVPASKMKSSSASVMTHKKKFTPQKPASHRNRVNKKTVHGHSRTPRVSIHTSASRRLPSRRPPYAGTPLSKKASLPRTRRQARTSSQPASQSIDNLLSTMNKRKRAR